MKPIRVVEAAISEAWLGVAMVSDVAFYCVKCREYIPSIKVIGGDNGQVKCPTCFTKLSTEKQYNQAKDPGLK